jgi:hypothetical protein
MTVFSSIAKCQAFDHAFPRHDQEPQWVVIKCGFLNQFLIDKEDYGFDMLNRHH